MKYIIPGLAILLFFSSCVDNSKSELAVFRTVANSLAQSNQTIAFSNQDMYRTLDNRLKDPKTAEFAKVWQPKAARISEITMPLIKFIKELKTDLKNEAGYEIRGKDMILKDDKLAPVRKIITKKNEETALYNKLMEFISVTKTFDEILNAQFGNNTKNTFTYLDSGKNAAAVFSKTFFNEISTARALFILEKIENDILNTENKFVSYCYYRTAPMDHGYKVFSAIIAQSSSCVKTGDYITITAGVGSFSISAKPQFTIDGNLITANADAVAEYKFKTQSKAGKYFKPVKIEYTEPDGNKTTKTFNIEYTVIEPNQNPQ